MARKTIMMQELEQYLTAIALEPEDLINDTRRLLNLYNKLTWIAELGGVQEYDRDGLHGAIDLYQEMLHHSHTAALVTHPGAQPLRDMMQQVLNIVQRYPEHGKQYHYILKTAYFDPAPQTDGELMDLLHLERTTYYSRKREAVTLFAILLHTKYMPQLHQSLH